MKHLLVICGASGVGKTTIQDYLVKNYGFKRVLTHTTRLPRKHEVDGRDYYFETRSSFFKNNYLEYVEYDHCLYGSSAEGLNRAWQTSDWAVIVLDTEGAAAYKQKVTADLKCWYIYVSSESTLAARLEERDTNAAARLASSEAQRDLHVPPKLKDFCNLIRNDEWQETKKIIAKLLSK
ncbi:hypothetical protein [Liquorilactobacillus capillatus]|uniref:Guanylate kinase n=1 Tax=Liquorilactobacillus capillatus DSM 19910 TaxID=1423731 RepID=A0A0R1M4H7_9LACO|nr:hypothetical protein [Liquorilactobacillus capillatus]KRL00548.1 Guanylate kinase [Liquorilactobacillus capillatus DSM 19910]